MGRNKKGSKENPITTEDLAAIMDPVQKPIEIISASINDELCNYSYEIKSGVGIGDKHNVKGSGIIDPDLSKAMATFNVHLAVIDEIFKNSGRSIEDIDQLHNDDLTLLYTVTGFKMKVSGDNEQISLTGIKYVSSAGGRLNIETHKIVLDQYSSYQWWNELKAAADVARQEVELYREGKCTPVEHEEPEEKFKQTKIFDNIPESEDENETVDPEFENAAV